MRQYKEGNVRQLIATDGASTKICGINESVVSTIINYDFPENKECYIHRVGSGNYYDGRRGNAINFCTDDEEPKVVELGKYVFTTMTELPTEPVDL